MTKMKNAIWAFGVIAAAVGSVATLLIKMITN